jgi:hypothetical protein
VEVVLLLERQLQEILSLFVQEGREEELMELMLPVEELAFLQLPLADRKWQEE